MRRRSFVQRHAKHIASAKHTVGEKYLALQLKIQDDTMGRRGISRELIEKEKRALERAIRAELLHLRPSSGGAL